MPAKTEPNGMYENRNVRKQIGCMNGIFQLFDRHHFLSGWHTSNHKHKKLPFGAQNQLEPHHATHVVTDKETEVQKQKPRISKESSQASNSSSSCSSTFSSLDHRRSDISENTLRITAEKQDGPSLAKGPESPHIRDVVKDSMYREARGVPIKSFTNDEHKVTVIKHIDSPRPLHKSKFERLKSYEESNRVFARHDRLVLHRLSCDGRESRDTLKTKHKELPRLSLDSKASSIKCSGLDSKLNFSGQEAGSHCRTSSVVAKLMGLGDFPNSTTADESKTPSPSPSPSPSPRVGFLSDSSTSTKESKGKQIPFSKPTLSSMLPMEPAPWKQKESNQNSPKMAAQNRKPPKITSNLPSSSVYAEMEKRITELQFKRSGKDLRALKQILEAMQKTRDKLENGSQKPDELPKPKQLCASNRAMKSSTVKKTHIRNLQTRGAKYHNRKNKEAFGERAENFIRTRNNDAKEPTRQFSSIDKKIRRNLEIQCTIRAPQRIRVDNCTTSERGSERSSESNRAKKHISKKVSGKFSSNRENKVKSVDLQSSDDQLSEVSSAPRYSSYLCDTASVKRKSNNRVASHFETEAMSVASSTNSDFREQQKSVSTSKEDMPAVGLAEQPSPVSVLDTAFYAEDLPSPVKKISTAFQDESPGPNEAEWPLVNLNHFSDYTQSNPGYNYNQKDMLPLIHEPRLLKTEPSRTAENQDESVHRCLMPDNRYINKILTASGLFEETRIMPTANQFISSHPINLDIFHVLEEMEEENGELTEQNNRELNQKLQRRVVFDMVNEILVRKITSGGLFTLGRKGMSPQGLVKELYLEMGRLCRMTYGNLDDEDDGSIRLLTADMKYQSDDWTDYSGEVPAIVMEIERLIFRDLINEVVTGQVDGLHDLPKKHCRQLFTK